MTEHMANEERKKIQQRQSMGGGKDESAANKALEYKTHDNTGHSHFNHKELIASDPKLSQFTVVKKNKAGQQQQQQHHEQQPQQHHHHHQQHQQGHSSSSSSSSHPHSHHHNSSSNSSHDPSTHIQKRSRPH